jgi:hypothetical protein
VPLLRQSLAAVAVLAFTGCSLGDDPTDIDLPRVELSISPAPTLSVGDRAHVIITQRYRVAGDARFRFSVVSSPSGSAAVDSAGRLSATAAGSSIISAEQVPSGRVLGQIALTVRPAVRITPGDFTLGTRGTQTLTAALVGLPAGADQRVDWSSSDTTIVTVGAAGTVAGLRVGITRITARSAADPTVSGSALVTVSSGGAPFIRVTPAAFSLVPGRTIQLLATPSEDGPAGPVVPGGVTFTSSDACVATVSAGGLVTGLNVGSARITVASQRDPSFTSRVSVSVMRQLAVRLTFQSITTTSAQGQNLPVDPNDVAGTVTVMVNAGVEDPPFSLVELVFGGGTSARELLRPAWAAPGLSPSSSTPPSAT